MSTAIVSDRMLRARCERLQGSLIRRKWPATNPRAPAIDERETYRVRKKTTEKPDGGRGAGKRYKRQQGAETRGNAFASLEPEIDREVMAQDGRQGDEEGKVGGATFPGP